MIHVLLIYIIFEMIDGLYLFLYLVVRIYPSSVTISHVLLDDVVRTDSSLVRMNGFSLLNVWINWIWFMIVEYLIIALLYRHIDDMCSSHVGVNFGVFYVCICVVCGVLVFLCVCCWCYVWW